MRIQHRVGVHYLKAATVLLHRIHRLHTTAGSLEVADLHWWWRTPRSTDGLPQLFWFDRRGRPEAAVIATDWGDGIVLDPIVMPDATADWVAHVIERGLAHAGDLGFGAIDIAVNTADDIMLDVLAGHGFTTKNDDSLAVTGAWLGADARPAISELHEGYQLCTRLDMLPHEHHMTARSGPQVETRLRQTTLYRPDFDLLVLDAEDAVAAYGLFWFDSQTASGLIEPIRTEAHHKRRGLARHLVTIGIALLAKAGAIRIKVCFNPKNEAARNLYLSVGFEPLDQTVVLAR